MIVLLCLSLCSFLGHCHTQLGTSDLTDRRVVFVVSGHRVARHHQLPDVRRGLQEGRQLAVRSVLPAKHVDRRDRRFRVHHRRDHKRVRHYPQHQELISLAARCLFR